MSIEAIFEVCVVDFPKQNLLLQLTYTGQIAEECPTFFFNSLTRLLKHLERKYFKRDTILLGGDF